MRSARALLLLALIAVTSTGEAKDPPGARMDRVSRKGGPRGLVIAAPHEGFDLHTAAIARGIAEALGAARVTATDYRKRSRRRFINVNRPTEEAWKDGAFGAEAETARAREIYERYQALIDAAAGAKPTPLLIEVHGNARKTKGGKSVEVVECAVIGWSEDELRALLRLWPEDAPPLYFDGLPEHRRYTYQGESLRFRYRAGGARKNGSLSRARRALHFECPAQARRDKERRRALIAALTRIVKAAARGL